MNNYKWNRNKSTIETSEQPKLIKERRQRVRRSMRKHRETEEEAIIRRYHDAQRMARFRARRKNALENAKILKAAHITELCTEPELGRKNIILESANFVTPTPNIQLDAHFFVQNSSILVQPICSQSKYTQLLAIIEELGKDVKLTYTGSKISAERLRFGIIRARMLIKEYLIEIEMNLQQ